MYECEENGDLRTNTTNKKYLSIEINPANECKFKIVPQKSEAEISFNSATITTFVLGLNIQISPQTHNSVWFP